VGGLAQRSSTCWACRTRFTGDVVQQLSARWRKQTSRIDMPSRWVTLAIASASVQLASWCTDVQSICRFYWCPITEWCLHWSFSIRYLLVHADLAVLFWDDRLDNLLCWISHVVKLTWTEVDQNALTSYHFVPVIFLYWSGTYTSHVPIWSYPWYHGVSPNSVQDYFCTLQCQTLSFSNRFIHWHIYLVYWSRKIEVLAYMNDGVVCHIPV